MHDIKTDDDLLAVLCDLKHYLKGGIPYSPLRADFNDAINGFLRRHRLDTDPQAFASMPRIGDPVPEGATEVFHDERVVVPEHPAVTLLREIEWSGEDNVCPSCGAWGAFLAVWEITRRIRLRQSGHFGRGASVERTNSSRCAPQESHWYS